MSQHNKYWNLPARLIIEELLSSFYSSKDHLIRENVLVTQSPTRPVNESSIKGRWKKRNNIETLPFYQETVRREWTKHFAHFVEMETFPLFNLVIWKMMIRLVSMKEAKWNPAPTAICSSVESIFNSFFTPAWSDLRLTWACRNGKVQKSPNLVFDFSAL